MFPNIGNSNVPQKLHLDYSTPEAAFSLRIDPHTGQGPMHIDSNLFTSATSMTSEGAARNKNQFWQLWSQKYPETLSVENLKRIQVGQAPKVDTHWAATFPEHHSYMNQWIEHHHIDAGNLSIPLPRDLHRSKDCYSIWHQ